MNKILRKEFVKFLLVELSFPERWIRKDYETLKHNQYSIVLEKFWKPVRVDRVKVEGERLKLGYFNEWKLGKAYDKVRNYLDNKDKEVALNKLSSKIGNLLNLPTTTKEISETYQIGSWKTND